MTTKALKFTGTQAFDEGIREQEALGFRLSDWKNLSDENWTIRAIFTNEKARGAMLTDLKSSLQKYLLEHRDVIFTVVLLFIVDAYLLDGALRSRLEGILHKTVDKLEGKAANVVQA